jgi:hypothetical protein
MFNLPTKCLIFPVLLCLVTVQSLSAQTKLPLDSISGKIAYKFTIELDKTYKDKALFQLIRDWFRQNPEIFTRSNTPDTGKVVFTDKKRNDSRNAIIKEFTNAKPLQSIDAETNRLSGKVMLRYTGGVNGCIRLFYIQYSVVLTVIEGKVTGEFSNFVYKHYNPRTYQEQPVFNWSGMMPCDEVNTLEYLMDCEACHKEFNGFYAFLNSDAEELINNLLSFSKKAKGVTMIIEETK